MDCERTNAPALAVPDVSSYSDDRLSRHQEEKTTSLRRRLAIRWQSQWTWFLPAFIVFYSFLKEIKLGEPFMFKYQTEYLNLTREQLKGEICKFNDLSNNFSFQIHGCRTAICWLAFQSSCSRIFSFTSRRCWSKYWAKLDFGVHWSLDGVSFRRSWASSLMVWHRQARLDSSVTFTANWKRININDWLVGLAPGRWLEEVLVMSPVRSSSFCNSEVIGRWMRSLSLCLVLCWYLLCSCHGFIGKISRIEWRKLKASLTLQV